MGTLANARTAKDNAVGECYDVINALVVLTPTDELTTTAKELTAIETRTRQYYITTSNGNNTTEEDGSTKNTA